MNERSGIQEVRETVPEPVFDRMVQTKTKDIMFKGKHEAQPTAAEIRDILNTTKNRELMIEMHGEEVVDDIYNTAKAIAAEEEAALAAKEAKALSKKETKEKWRSRLKTAQKSLAVAKYIGLI
jgi:rubrerythrin